MRAVEPSTALQSTPTAELETLVSVYSLASNSPELGDFQRSAILRGLIAELTERTVLRKSHFASGTKDDYILELESKIVLLDSILDEAGSGKN
jgi:hypothetical protein